MHENRAKRAKWGCVFLGNEKSLYLLLLIWWRKYPYRYTVVGRFWKFDLEGPILLTQKKCYFWVEKIGPSRSNFQNRPTTVYLYGYFVHHIKSWRYSDFSLQRKTHPRFALFALFSCIILWLKIWNLVKTK